LRLTAFTLLWGYRTVPLLQMPIGLAFSPCMRYLATGSEDKAAYVYDLRSCSMLGRLRPPGHTAEVVTDVAFHPWRPELVVGCMDGRVHCYADVF
jgi:WD40 repeat protein